MRAVHPYLALLLTLALLTPLPISAKTRKGDKLYNDGRNAESRQQWDRALELFEQAVAEDPTDAAYLMGVRRVRFQAGQAHVDKGQHMRSEGKLDDALIEFRKAFAIDPASSIADQEIRRTQEMIELHRRKTAAGESKPDEVGLTPFQVAKKEGEERIATMMGVPELRPMSNQLLTLKTSNQPAKILFETIAKVAGVNVVFDSEYNLPGRNFSLDLTNATLEQALDYLAVQTKSFWKPLSQNTIFVTQDNVTKRRDYEDLVARVFYLANTTTAQELQEVATAVRSVTEIRRIFTYNPQNAILVRGTVDQMALAEKLIQDLDKPKSEVVVDVVVMEVNTTHERDLAAGLATGGTQGVKIPIAFTPRNPVLQGGTDTGSGSGSGSGSTPATTTSQAISLARIGRISTNDFSLTLPGAIFNAMLSDRGTKVLQSPQVRAVELQKASLRIGDKIPYATGSFQPGVGAVGVSPLVSTQFNFAEVGVNVDITPKVHGPDEVSLHVELEISNVRDRVDIGGISQPVIGQRKVIHDIRIREGEVNLLGGLMQSQETKTLSGIPGLSNIPGLRRLFSSETYSKDRGELLIALIPHIVRAPELTPTNLKGIYVGNDATIKVNYAPRTPEPQPATPTPKPEAPKPEAAVRTPETPAVTAGASAAAPSVLAAVKPALSPAGGPAVGGAAAGPAGGAAVSAPATSAPATSPPKPAPEAAKAPAAIVPTQLSFDPPLVQGKVKGVVWAALQINQGSDLFSAPMTLKYDPKMLKLINVIPGNVMQPAGETLDLKQNIDAKKGVAEIEVSRKANTGGVNGSGPVVLFRFEALKKGTTHISLEDLNLRNSRQQPISVLPPAVTVKIE